MLDRTKELIAERPAAERTAGNAGPRPAGRGILRRVADSWHYFVGQGSSSLTRRIVFLNVAGLFALFVGILYLSQSRQFFIEARIRSLQREAARRRLALPPPNAAQHHRDPHSAVEQAPRSEGRDP